MRAGGDPEICVLPTSAADVEAIFRNLLTELYLGQCCTFELNVNLGQFWTTPETILLGTPEPLTPVGKQSF